MLGAFSIINNLFIMLFNLIPFHVHINVTLTDALSEWFPVVQ